MVQTAQFAGKKIEGCSNLSQKCSWQFSSLCLTEEQQDLKAEAAVRKIQSGKETQDTSRRAGDVGSATQKAAVLPILQPIPVCEMGKSRFWGGSIALLCTSPSVPRGASAVPGTPGLPVLATTCSWPARHRGRRWLRTGFVFPSPFFLRMLSPAQQGWAALRHGDWTPCGGVTPC